jgi:FixJ family two-component response regulator
VALVITDLRMPDESGLRLIQRLRASERGQDLPIMVTSGHADMDDVISVMRMRVVDFLRKPIYHEHLLQQLDQMFPRGSQL